MEKKRLLIIDDEKDYCYLVKKNLEQRGDFKVEFYCDGEIGIKRIKEWLPDVVLLDIIMPGIDGTDVAAALRSHADTRGIPFAFLTALVRKREMTLSTNYIGGEYYISKTASIEEMITAIHELTTRNKEARQHRES